MGEYKLGRYSLRVIQGSESDSVMLLNNRLSTMRTTSANYSAMLNENAVRIADLQKRLNNYERFEAVAPDVAREAATLFPAVEAVNLSLSAQATADTTAVRLVPTAVVSLKRGAALEQRERSRMAEWVKTRIGVDTLQFVISQSAR